MKKIRRLTDTESVRRLSIKPSPKPIDSPDMPPIMFIDNTSGSAAEELLQYLRSWGELRRRLPNAHEDSDFMSIHEYVLEHGQLWKQPAPALPPNIKRMTPKLCFDNAYRLAVKHKTLQYVEGYAARFIAVHHAWCVTADGTVIDPTWENSGTGQGRT